MGCRRPVLQNAWKVLQLQEVLQQQLLPYTQAHQHHYLESAAHEHSSTQTLHMELCLRVAGVT
jgi:hypothetical protein